MKNTKYKVIFFGTPDFSIPCLEILFFQPKIELNLVVTQPDRPAGRGQKNRPPPVAEFAKSHNIPLLQTENINKDERFSKILTQEWHFFVVVAFSHFLGNKILKTPKYGCFNVHASLLPKYRGAAPIQYTLLKGETVTGISIQRMVKKMDAGDIVKESNIPISPWENFGGLYTQLKFLAATTLHNFLDDLFKENLHFKSQDESKVSFAPTLKKEDGEILFTEMKDIEIWQKVKAFHPFPGTYFFLNKKRIIIHEVIPIEKNITPGEIQTKNGFYIGCKNGAIEILRLQWAGKKICSGKEFINGLRGQITIK